VDDDRQLCDLLVDALGQAGYEVMAAQSATDALAAIASACGGFVREEESWKPPDSGPFNIRAGRKAC
jgi:CheY-like chemotaxis protein